MIKVVIADDQALVRGGFRMILTAQPDIDVIGEAENGAEAVALAGELRPDVVLMDVRMPVMDGLEAARRILQDQASNTKVVMLTTFDLDEYIYQALLAGASGFLLKETRPEVLAAAVRTVVGGEALLAPAVAASSTSTARARPILRRTVSPASPNGRSKSYGWWAKAAATPRLPSIFGWRKPPLNARHPHLHQTPPPRPRASRRHRVRSRTCETRPGPLTVDKQ